MFLMVTVCWHLRHCLCRSYVSGGALVTTFEFILPTEFQKASRQGPTAPCPWLRSCRFAAT